MRTLPAMSLPFQSLLLRFARTVSAAGDSLLRKSLPLMSGRTVSSAGDSLPRKSRLQTLGRTVRLGGGSLVLSTLVLVAWANPTSVPTAAAAPSVRFQASSEVAVTPPRTSSSALPAGVSSVFVRFPQTSTPGQPLRVLVALHGIGGDGETFARDLTAAADQYGWVLVAPTIAYGDWMDPVQVAHEDAVLINWLSAYLDQLPSRTNQRLEAGVRLLGFSRGAQLAHRFAEAYPRRTVAVAAVSAGAYTLPQATSADGTLLAFPFGVGDLAASVGPAFNLAALRSVHFWIGVGNNDTNPVDVPRQFDLYQGDDRLDRAQAFVAALGALDVSAQLAVFPNVPHALTPDMEGAAIAFLANPSTPTA